MFFLYKDAIEGDLTEKTSNYAKMSEEVIANSILNSSGVDYNDVPIDIRRILINYGFAIGIAKKFAKEEVVAGIAYSGREHSQLKSNKIFIFKEDVPNRDRRYLMALAITSYVSESNSQYFAKTFSNNVLIDSDEINSNDARIARAVLMPQKSLSTLIMSPMINKLDKQEKIDSVAKAFLVSNDIAKVRMIETGLI